MKKLMMAVIAAVSMTTFAETTNTYNFKMSAKVPYVQNGLRQYSSQTFSGYLYLTYNDSEELSEAYAIVKNSKTKITHTLIFSGEGLFNRIGKSNKYVTRTIPVIKAEAADSSDLEDGHEFIKSVSFAGNGTVANLKSSLCSSCCGATPTICSYVNKMNGYFVGVMDCLCPEDEDWNHTLVATRCGVTEDRSHDAPFWGTWSATWNAKLNK